MAVVGRRVVFGYREPLVRCLFSRSRRKSDEEFEDAEQDRTRDENRDVPLGGKRARENLMEDIEAEDGKKEVAILKSGKVKEGVMEAVEGEVAEGGEVEGSTKKKLIEDKPDSDTPSEFREDGAVANARELPITIEGDTRTKEVVLSVSPKDVKAKVPKKKESLWRRLASSKKKTTEVPAVPEDEVDAVATWFNRTFVPATSKSNALETVSSLVVKNFSQGDDSRDKETIKTRVTRSIKRPGNWTTVLPLFGKPKQQTPQLWYTAMLPFRVMPQQTDKEVVSSNYFRLITQERSVEASSLTSGVPPPPTPALWPIGKMTGSTMTDMFGKPEPWYKRNPSSWLWRAPEPWWKKAITPWLKYPSTRSNPWNWLMIKRLMDSYLQQKKVVKVPALALPKMAKKEKPAALPPPKPKK